MNKKIIIPLSIALVVGVITIPKLPFLQADSKSMAGNPAADQRLAVRAHIIQPASFQDKIFTTGTVLANEEVELRSETSGKVIGIYFNEGSRVRRGNLLVKINDAELRAQLLRAEHQIALAEVKEFRQRSLLQSDGISQQEYDIALNELNTRKAEVDLIKAQIEKTEVRAPFNGVIGLRYVSEGSYVSTSSKIAGLQSTDPVKIDFSIPERYAHLVKQGDQINFTVQGSADAYRGSVYAVEPKIDLVTRTVQLRARAPNKEGKILPGAFSRVELVISEIHDALMVPTESLLPQMSGHRVLLYRNGVVELKDIETGNRTETMVHATSGLAAGDTILTTGLLQVRPGMPVRITDFSNQKPLSPEL